MFFLIIQLLVVLDVSKIKNLNCFGAFIGVLLVLGKKPFSLPDKL